MTVGTGPGRVGKTRLATTVAAELWRSRADGVWFVDLVPVSDSSLVPAAVAAALGVDDPRGRTIDDAVLARLAGSDALLVLDNCEHLSRAVAVFAERLLGHCPGVTVLATSRARLMLPFEWVFPVPGLSLPDDTRDGDAVALFVERARQGSPGCRTTTAGASGSSCAARWDGARHRAGAARVPTLIAEAFARRQTDPQM